MFTFKMKAIAALGAIAAMSFAFLMLPQTSSSVPLAIAASSDYFLKIEGIDGEVSIESFSWGVTSSRERGSGQATGRRQYEPIIIRKRIDKSSPLLFRMAVDGTKMKTLVLTGVDADGRKFESAFFDVFVEAYKQAGEPGAAPTESISFVYQKIEMK